MAIKHTTVCNTCGTHNITIKHILTEFIKYEDLRKENDLPQRLYEILGPGEEANTKILNF